MVASMKLDQEDGHRRIAITFERMPLGLADAAGSAAAVSSAPLLVMVTS